MELIGDPGERPAGRLAPTADGGPPLCRGLYQELSRRAAQAVGDSGDDSDKDRDLDKLRARIQALRAKTVDQGCTEEEALAAAAKVAELLDRHGLSLSEPGMRRQTCEGAAIETGRRRRAPAQGLP